MRVLTLDTAPATNERLRSAGYDVTEASFGYRDGRRALYAAPYEFDAIVFDLQKPACFDSAAWGSNGNDNFKCSLIPSEQLTWETRRIGAGTAVSEEQRYKLIQESQIIGMSVPKSPFGPGDVRDAIKKAGVPLIIFLNREWALRTGHIPYIFGGNWYTQVVRSERITLSPPLEPLMPAIAAFAPQLPISTAVVQDWQGLTDTEQVIVGDRIGNRLGVVVTLGHGSVWMLPEMTDNAEVCVQLLAAIQQGTPAVPDPVPAPVVSAVATPVADDEHFDVFLSHASEDKGDFADSLAQLLRARGVRVWYDNFILKPGDSLSRKIDDGLKRSHYGVLVLSHSFFEKRWPDSEYRALLALGSRVIPVWHNVGHEDVAQYSPLLLDIFAVRSDLGVESAVRQIITVVRPDLVEAAAAPPPATAAAAPASQADANYANYDLAPYRVGDEGVPSDALPWQPYAANAQPCLDARFGEPMSIDIRETKRWRMTYTIRNVGAGTARAIRIFLPYLDVSSIEVLEPREERNLGTFLNDHVAFWNFVKLTTGQAVFEYEDISGFLFRQYGVVEQGAVPSGAFHRFSIRAVGKPYRVSKRIVTGAVPPAWLMNIPS